MKKIILLLFLLSINSSFATTNCPADGAVVESIEISNSIVYAILQGGVWHNIGLVNDESTKMKLSVLLTSRTASIPVMLNYPEGFDCSANNYEIPTLKVRLK